MSAALNDSPILSGYLTIPEYGNWTAVLTVASDSPIVGAVTLSSDGSDFSGTVIKGGEVHANRVKVFVVGGKGGLTQSIDPKHHQSATLAQVAGDILTDAGETLDPTSSPLILTKTIAKWSRFRGTASQALSSLVSAFDGVWRVMPSGNVWLATQDIAFTVTQQALILDADLSAGLYVSAPDGLWLLPGMIQNAGKIKRVEYDFSQSLRATYWV